MGVKLCRNCKTKIKFRQVEGRWRPFDYDSDQAHRCPPVEKTCERCGKAFTGEAWKTTCVSCWKAERDGQEPVQKTRSEPEKRGEPDHDRPHRDVPF